MEGGLKPLLPKLAKDGGPEKDVMPEPLGALREVLIGGC
jgi:hypothetical protein